MVVSRSNLFLFKNLNQTTYCRFLCSQYQQLKSLLYFFLIRRLKNRWFPHGWWPMPNLVILMWYSESILVMGSTHFLEILFGFLESFFFLYNQNVNRVIQLKFGLKNIVKMSFWHTLLNDCSHSFVQQLNPKLNGLGVWRKFNFLISFSFIVQSKIIALILECKAQCDVTKVATI